MRYNVTLTDQHGCSTTDELLIKVRHVRPMYVGNVFKPGSGGDNALLYPQAAETLVENIESWKIYDRWGEPVFENFDFQPNNPAAGWNGKIRGVDAQVGVYAWFMVVQYVDGVEEVVSGEVTVVR